MRRQIDYPVLLLTKLLLYDMKNGAMRGAWRLIEH